MLSLLALAVSSQPAVFDLTADPLDASRPLPVIFVSTPSSGECSYGTDDLIVLIGPIFSLAPLAAFCLCPLQRHHVQQSPGHVALCSVLLKFPSFRSQQKLCFKTHRFVCCSVWCRRHSSCHACVCDSFSLRPRSNCSSLQTRPCPDSPMDLTMQWLNKPSD